MGEEAKIAEREICKFFKFFFIQMQNANNWHCKNILIIGCREVEGLLHTDKDPRPHLHHRPNPQLSPHQHISLTLWPHPHPTRQQGYSHKHYGHSHQLHGHRTQVSGTLQTSSTQLEELFGFLQANQHHIPLQKHGTVEYHHHRYCSVRFDFLFIKLWYW